VTRIREFRYGGGLGVSPGDRVRYLERDRDPLTFAPTADTWHEYVGDNIYQDLLIDATNPQAPVVTPLARYGFGAGLVRIDDTTGQRFVHSDMLGTMRSRAAQVSSRGRGASPAVGGFHPPAVRHGLCTVVPPGIQAAGEARPASLHRADPHAGRGVL